MNKFRSSVPIAVFCCKCWRTIENIETKGKGGLTWNRLRQHLCHSEVLTVVSKQNSDFPFTILLILWCLVSTERSYILKQTYKAAGLF